MLNIQNGQVYLDEAKNEYLVVTKTDRGRVSYQGPGFTGAMEDENFIEKFLPVNPVDLEKEEADQLLSFCATGGSLKTGLILD